MKKLWQILLMLFVAQYSMSVSSAFDCTLGEKGECRGSLTLESKAEIFPIPQNPSQEHSLSAPLTDYGTSSHWRKEIIGMTVGGYTITIGEPYNDGLNTVCVGGTYDSNYCDIFKHNNGL